MAHLYFYGTSGIFRSLEYDEFHEAKRFLDKHKIAYTEINIETTPGAANEVVRNTGKRAIPQFVVDGKWVQPYQPGQGFLYEEMSALLGCVQRLLTVAEVFCLRAKE